MSLIVKECVLKFVVPDHLKMYFIYFLYYIVLYYYVGFDMRNQCMICVKTVR